jgi:hypothetical protein
MTDVNEESLFLAALERATPDARRALLDGAYGADAARRERLLRFVAAHEKASGILERGAVPRLTTAPVYDANGPKEKADHWRKRREEANAAAKDKPDPK